MNDEQFNGLLVATLREPMDDRQRTIVDESVATAMAGSGGAPGGLWWRLTTRTGILVAVLTLLIVPSIFAAGTMLLRSEDPFGLAGDTEFQREIEAAKAVTPIPAGYTWPASLHVQKGHSYSRGGAYQWVGDRAMCMWIVDWLDTRGTADAGRHTTAQQVIRGYPSWRSYSGVFADQSYRDLMDRVIAAVGRDDPAPVTTYVGLNCQGVRP